MADIKNLGDYTRDQMFEFLPPALEIAFASYHEFAAKSQIGDAAGFKKHHDACKAAIAHIYLLLKLAKLADLEGKNHGDNNISDKDQKALNELLKNAQNELSGKK